MELLRLDIEDIEVGEGRRAADPKTVAKLADSMREIDLQTPISIWIDDDQLVHLVAGRHRLEAAKLLGWDRIDCFVVKLDARQRRMWELSENLHRAELTALQRDEHIAEWDILSGSPPPPGEGREFPSPSKPSVKATARALGVDPKEVREARRVAALPPEVKQEAKRLGLDRNHSALAAAAKEPTPDAQINALRRKAASKSVSGDQEMTPDRRVSTAVRSVEKLSNEELLRFHEWLVSYMNDRRKS